MWKMVDPMGTGPAKPLQIGAFCILAGYEAAPFAKFCALWRQPLGIVYKSPLSAPWNRGIIPQKLEKDWFYEKENLRKASSMEE